jgi:hypothetical protein
MILKIPNRLIYHTDAGHGWLACKRQLIQDLGIIDKLSSGSYQKGGTVYLEEDGDADTFFEALKLHGVAIEEIKSRITTSYRENSPVRCYARFSP